MITDWTFKPLSYVEMNARFQTSMPRRGWKHAAQILSSKTPDYSNLEIAEVGCGTGTFSLLFGLLGAKVVLIDFDKSVLEAAKKIYEMWRVSAEFYNLSCYAFLCFRAECFLKPQKRFFGRGMYVDADGSAKSFV